MKIEMAAKTDVGKVRKANEDHYSLFDDDNMAILCDGMGGHKAGAKASQLAVSTIRYVYSFLDQKKHYKIAADLDEAHKEMAARLVSSIRLANRQIYNKALEKQYNGMGTTISELVLRENTACICHVGDSRVYRLRNDEFELLTEDHSWVNELIQDREIEENEASRFEKKNVITRALGLAPSVKIDLKLEPAEVGDIFLLCSDGLTGGLSDDEIKDIISYNIDNLENAVTELIDSANDSDGSDNITVSLVKVLEKNSFDKTLLPSSVTLKTEPKDVSSLENEILKKEFSKKNSINFSWMKKYIIVFAIVAILLSSFIFVKYSFIDLRNENAIAVSKEIDKTIESNLSDNNILHNVENTVDSTMKAQLTTPQLLNNDENSVSNDTLNNKVTQNEKILTKSLNKTSRNRGLIYIVGLENLVKQQKTFLFLNQRLLGNTGNFFESGIPVRPGQYKIAIKDSNQTMLYQHDNIWISAGDIKAIEFVQQKNLKENASDDR